MSKETRCISKETRCISKETRCIERDLQKTSTNTNNGLVAAPSEQPTDLSFLDFQVVPPVSAQHSAPLKKLEFKDFAPTPRAPSPDYVRSPAKSPKRQGADGVVPPEEVREVKGGVRAEKGGATEGDGSNGGQEEEGGGEKGEQEEDAGPSEEIVEVAGEDSMGAYGNDSMEAETESPGV